jgi:quercetin dioxygenase-like cupin family protein
MGEKRWEYKLKKLGELPAHEFEGMSVAPAITKDETEKMVAYHIRIPKNVRIPHSYHKIAHEIVFVLDGCGTAHLNQDNVILRPGAVILIRPETWHSFSTADRTLEFLAIASPRVDADTDLYYR